MANKISQITVGDALYIQLDADPVTDGIGYNAPLGSFGFTSTGKAFIKISGPATRWHTLTDTFLNGGNTFGSSPILALGSIVDKDLKFIRNNLEGMRFFNQATIDPDFFQVGIKFLNDKLRITNHNVKNDELINNSIVSSNTHLPMTPLESDRTSLISFSQGYNVLGANLGTIIGHAPTHAPTVPDEDVFLSEGKKGVGILNKLITGAITSFNMSILQATDVKMLHVEVLIMIRNIADNKISQRRKFISVKCTDFANRQYAQVFDGDAYSYFDTDAFNFNLSYVNTSDNARPDKPLNTYLPVVNITDLTIGQSYDIAIYMTNFTFEDQN